MKPLGHFGDYTCEYSVLEVLQRNLWAQLATDNPESRQTFINLFDV